MVLKSIRALEIPCPPLNQQRRIAQDVTRHLAVLGDAEQAAKESHDAILALQGAAVRQVFQEGQ